MREKSTLEHSNRDDPWWYIFRSRDVRLRTLLGVAIMSFNQLTGVNFFFYYGTSIFTTTGISNGYAIQVIVSTVNVISTIPGLYFAQRFKRRRCLVVGAICMAICFVVFSSIGHFILDRDDPTRTPAAGAVMITVTLIFIAAFASTWSPLSWGEASLVCPAHCRATCASVATASLWMWSFLLAFFTPMITARIDYLYGYVFAGCCLLMAGSMHWFLLESQGRTVEEIDIMYRKWLGPDIG